MGHAARVELQRDRARRISGEDFDQCIGLTYTVLSVPGDEVIGCVYVYGSRQRPGVMFAPGPGEPRFARGASLRPPEGV
jgi:hypothetical protein